MSRAQEIEEERRHKICEHREERRETTVGGDKVYVCVTGEVDCARKKKKARKRQAGAL